jgi:serine protease inhibitor ecotin
MAITIQMVRPDTTRNRKNTMPNAMGKAAITVYTSKRPVVILIKNSVFLFILKKQKP